MSNKTDNFFDFTEYRLDFFSFLQNEWQSKGNIDIVRAVGTFGFMLKDRDNDFRIEIRIVGGKSIPNYPLSYHVVMEIYTMETSDKIFSFISSRSFGTEQLYINKQNIFNQLFTCYESIINVYKNTDVRFDNIDNEEP